MKYKKNLTKFEKSIDCFMHFSLYNIFYILLVFF